MLENTASWFNWGYVPAGIDKKHPLLSPIYAPKDAFAAQKMFFVGAEYDYLCTEASNMAEKLAGRGETKEPVDVAKLEEKWDENGIKWKMYRGQQHGFTHTTASGEAEKLRKKATDDCFTEMGRWLQEDVWAKSKNPKGQANGNLVDI
ncbi:MAG: hypothetical protein M1823_008334 [Watsoniomyces obsoletus]|nr:MAG: hypothetical protein M1823_008334 [Watsoniomyces obsoletus]